MNTSPTPPQDSATKADDRLFLTLVRELAREGGFTETISDEDARAVLAHLDSLEATYVPLPAEGTPEFFAEIHRRGQDPVLDGRTVAAFLQGRKAAST